MATSDRGFASMNEKQQKDIASHGGKASHASGHGHEFSAAEAAAAGHKGGKSSGSDAGHMADIGKKGGKH